MTKKNGQANESGASILNSSINDVVAVAEEIHDENAQPNLSLSPARNKSTTKAASTGKLNRSRSQTKEVRQRRLSFDATSENSPVKSVQPLSSRPPLIELKQTADNEDLDVAYYEMSQHSVGERSHFVVERKIEHGVLTNKSIDEPVAPGDGSIHAKVEVKEHSILGDVAVREHSIHKEVAVENNSILGEVEVQGHSIHEKVAVAKQATSAKEQFYTLEKLKDKHLGVAQRLKQSLDYFNKLKTENFLNAANPYVAYVELRKQLNLIDDHKTALLKEHSALCLEIELSLDDDGNPQLAEFATTYNEIKAEIEETIEQFNLDEFASSLFPHYEAYVKSFSKIETIAFLENIDVEIQEWQDLFHDYAQELENNLQCGLENESLVATINIEDLKEKMNVVETMFFIYQSEKMFLKQHLDFLQQKEIDYINGLESIFLQLGFGEFSFAQLFEKLNARIFIWDVQGDYVEQSKALFHLFSVFCEIKQLAEKLDNMVKNLEQHPLESARLQIVQSLQQTVEAKLQEVEAQIAVITKARSAQIQLLPAAELRQMQHLANFKVRIYFENIRVDKSQRKVLERTCKELEERQFASEDEEKRLVTEAQRDLDKNAITLATDEAVHEDSKIEFEELTQALKQNEQKEHKEQPVFQDPSSEPSDMQSRQDTPSVIKASLEQKYPPGEEKPVAPKVIQDQKQKINEKIAEIDPKAEKFKTELELLLREKQRQLEKTTDGFYRLIFSKRKSKKKNEAIVKLISDLHGFSYNIDQLLALLMIAVTNHHLMGNRSRFFSFAPSTTAAEMCGITEQVMRERDRLRAAPAA